MWCFFANVNTGRDAHFLELERGFRYIISSPFKVPQRILLKFGLNSFQVRVVLPASFGPVLAKWKIKKERK